MFAWRHVIIKILKKFEKNKKNAIFKSSYFFVLEHLNSTETTAFFRQNLLKFVSLGNLPND